jgi:pimeloyl-ACP methyl ester carboxylesterase
MAQFSYEQVTINYEDRGDGPPLLLLAPGGMESTIEGWDRAALNPLKVFDGHFRLVAMDQRNAGHSSGPFPTEDPWQAYVVDQLALMDHLGIDRFSVLGCCIGCSYALKMAELAPDRLLAAVLEQPIGVTDENRSHWITGYRNFVERVLRERPGLRPDKGETFGEAMWKDREFVVSVTEDSVRSCRVPLLVLPGTDSAHPREIGVRVAELAPGAELIDPWKDTAEHLEAATEAARRFIARHGSTR